MKTSRQQLTPTERSTIKGMLNRKDRIQDIAYFFGKSPATIHAIKKDKRVEYWGEEELPPPGPYQLVAKEGLAKIEAKAARVDQAEAALAAADEIVKQLNDLLQVFQKRRDILATCSAGSNSYANVSMVN